MKTGIVLLFIPVLSFAATGFDQVFKSMSPISSNQIIETQYQSPLYRGLQLELRTGGSDPLELGGAASRASVKLSPLAWGQLGKEKELYQEYRKFSQTLNTEGSSSECLYRSLLLANTLHTTRTLKILRTLETYYEDQNKILRRGIGENLFEFKELLSVREALVKNKLKIAETEKLAETIEKSLNERLTTPVKIADIDFKNFMNIRKIKEVAGDLEPRAIELKKLSSLVKIHNLELEIEQKEANQVIDSLQLYRWDDQSQRGVTYGLQVTFNLPYFNKRNYIKESVQRQIALNKLAETQREVISEISGTEKSFRNKIEQYEALVGSDYYKTLKSLKKLLTGSRNNSPLMILQTKVKMASERLKLLDLKNEIIQEYLEKLFYSGKIKSCDSPSHLARN